MSRSLLQWIPSADFFVTPFIIPFFISHQGCPHQCVFCNQHVIAGPQEWVSAAKVREEIEHCLTWPRDEKRPVQVAFYGGSFTGLPTERQEELLGAVQPFLVRGLVDSIRLSTRPDYIDEDTVNFLKERGVALVELGIQSFDPEVLGRCRRGHSPEQVEDAFRFLQKAGLPAGGQLMVGLPGESPGQLLSGARRLAALRPRVVRIYPALVLKGSPLAEQYERGEYNPLPLSRAVLYCARMKEIFAAHHIPVIRMGLQPSASLEQDLVAGPYHPAFGELVLSRLYFEMVRKYLRNLKKEKSRCMVVLFLARKDQSIFIGQKKCSIKSLHAMGLLEGVEIQYQTDRPSFSIGHEFQT